MEGRRSWRRPGPRRPEHLGLAKRQAWRDPGFESCCVPTLAPERFGSVDDAGREKDYKLTTGVASATALEQ